MPPAFLSYSPIIGGWGDFGIVSIQSSRNALRDGGNGRLFGAARFVVSDLSCLNFPAAAGVQ